MTTAVDILNRAIDFGNEASEAATGYLSQAITASAGAGWYDAAPIAELPPVQEPKVFIPERAAGVDKALFDSTYSKIINDLGGKYGEFLNEYFPVDAGLMAAVEAWLRKAVSEGGSGINASVENKLWQRDRDRITAGKNATQATMLGTWAAKGFPLPPGAAAAAFQAVEVKTFGELNESSRARAIKAFETEIENTRFAIKTAIDYRSASIAAAGDYMRVLALGPQLATQIATASADAQSRLIGAASSYYNARINVAQLAQQRNLAQAEAYDRASLDATDKNQARTNTRVNAAISAAQTLGQQAAAALNAVNATVQIIESNA